MGHHFHLISVTEFDFTLRIPNIKISLDFFLEIFWKSGNFPEFAMFGQFQYKGHHFHLILVTEIDFALRITNFHTFLEFFQIFSGNMEFATLVKFNISGMIPI